MTRWKLVLFLVFLCVAINGSDVKALCRPVFEELVQCMEASPPVTLRCPSAHFIIIDTASINTAPSAECPESHDPRRACAESDITRPVALACRQKHECTFEPQEPAARECPQSSGPLYVYIKYKCDPVHNAHSGAGAVAVCDSESFSGTLVHLDSHPLALLGNYIASSNCSCSLTVPAQTQVLVKPLVYRRQPSLTGADDLCAQRVEFVEGHPQQAVCGEGNSHSLMLGCSPEAKTYSVVFHNDVPSTQVIFVIAISVSHSGTMTLQCGEAVSVSTSTVPASSTSTPKSTSTSTTTTSTSTTTSTTPRTTTTTTTSSQMIEATTTTPVPAPSTTASTSVGMAMTSSDGQENTATPGDEDNGDLDATGAIIGGSVVAGVLLVLIAIGVVLIRRKRNNDSDIAVSAEDTGSQFTSVTEMYVDGDQRSKLVIGRKPKTPLYFI